jgi:hypothetical protein
MRLQTRGTTGGATLFRFFASVFCGVLKVRLSMCDSLGRTRRKNNSRPADEVFATTEEKQAMMTK